MPDVLPVSGAIHRAIYEFNNKRYMDIRIDNETSSKIEKVHSKFQKGVWNPLSDGVLRVKVPYRYRRVDCKVEGLTPVQDMKKDDDIESTIQFCGAWDTGLYWKFVTIRQIDKNIY